jgi:type II restriction enzyme
VFARFLDTCACCSGEEGVLEAVRALDQRSIKGLGPAAANLLYFMIGVSIDLTSTLEFGT